MTTRTLSAIALDALACETLKGNARLYSRSYLEPMVSLYDINSTFMQDSARSIVLYALSNLSGWRGDDARRFKAELNTHLKG